VLFCIASMAATTLKEDAIYILKSGSKVSVQLTKWDADPLIITKRPEEVKLKLFATKPYGVIMEMLTDEVRSFHGDEHVLVLVNPNDCVEFTPTEQEKELEATRDKLLATLKTLLPGVAVHIVRL